LGLIFIFFVFRQVNSGIVLAVSCELVIVRSDLVAVRGELISVRGGLVGVRGGLICIRGELTGIRGGRIGFGQCLFVARWSTFRGGHVGSLGVARLGDLALTTVRLK
jgi:hypothetical protein